MRAVVAAVALALLASACTSDDPFDALREPDEVDVDPTTTVAEPDLTGVQLAPVAGSTTSTVVLGPGPMTLVGRVQGPEGDVAGAVVQLERLVGDGVAATRVPTAADGTWNLSNVLGGRYRIRAWKAPDLATPAPQIVFLETLKDRAVSIRLESVGGVRVDAAIAPDPPIVDEAANLKVRVAERTVDGDGIIRDSPVSGTLVELRGSGDWAVDSPNPRTTLSDGGATFRVVCRGDGEQPMFATLEDGQSHALALPPCFDPDATTTSTSTTSTTDDE